MKEKRYERRKFIMKSTLLYRVLGVKNYYALFLSIFENYAGMSWEGRDGGSAGLVGRHCPAERSSLNCLITRSMSPSQSPGMLCRRSLAVGYQGVVSICCIQRQSER